MYAQTANVDIALTSADKLTLSGRIIEPVVKVLSKTQKAWAVTTA